MASTFSTNLKIELQATGENSGTWGTITNTNLGTALEQAIVGYGNPSYASDANLTLTYTDTNAAQAARALVLNVTSAVSLTATRELVVPTIQKQYIVQNNTTGSQSITVKTSAGTGITVSTGRKAHLYVDGTNVIFMDDFVDINGGSIDGTTIGANSAAAGNFTTVDTTNIEVSNLKAKDGTAAGSIADSTGVVTLGSSVLTTTDINGGTIDGTTIGGGTAAAGTFTTLGATTGNITTVNATTVDTTNVEVTNIKAKDGTAAGSIADSTGVVTLASSVLTTTDINGGTIDGTTIGGSSAAAGTFTSATVSTGNLTFSSTAQRITGDFSNATLSNRLAFQTSTTNGNTIVGAFPNGTGTNARLQLFSASDPANASTASMEANATSSLVIINADKTGTGTYLPMTFYTGGSERMRLDTSGNLGLGVTPSAWGGSFKALQISNSSVYNNGGNDTFVGANFFWDGTNNKYIATDFAAAYGQQDGEHRFYTAPSGTAGNNATFTERMRIDSSGNVGIGGTAAAYEKISVSGTYPTSSNVSQGFVSKATIPSGATSSFVGYYSVPSTQAAAFTCTSLYHFLAGFGTKGASSAITSQYGFLAGSDLTGATNNYGFYSDIASGSNRWNFYAAGTADNYFAGNVGIGTTNIGTAGLSLSQTVNLSWEQSSTESLPNIFRQASSAATVITNGYKRSATANGFASSYGSSWAKSAISLGTASGSITFYTDTAATTAVGTDVTPTERMRITSGGELLVGTAALATGLSGFAQIEASGTTGGIIINSATNNIGRLMFTNANTGGGEGLIRYDGSNTSMQFYTNAGERMRITSDGEVYIAGTTDQGAYNLQCNGTGVWGAGAYVNGSDARLKDNIQSLDSGLDVVKAMRPVTFQYKPEYSKDQNVQPGFIAQELQQAMAGKPYLEGVVQEGPNHLNVAYQNIIPILVKAIQELEAKVAALEAK